MDARTKPLPPAGRGGFSLVELLAVTAIIALLMGLAASAAFSAHQRAYRAQATVEAQQVAAALRSYWVANRKWPDGLKDVKDEALNEDNLKELVGANEGGVVYLAVPPERFESLEPGNPDAKKFYLDPWGNPYHVTTRSPDRTDETSESGTITVKEMYESVVAFPNQFGDYYQPGVYTENSTEWGPDGLTPWRFKK